MQPVNLFAKEKKRKEYKARLDTLNANSILPEHKRQLCTITPTSPSPAQSELNNINLRAMMAVYYQGAGPRDISNVMSFLGVPGGHTFHNIFYKNILYYKNAHRFAENY